MFSDTWIEIHGLIVAQAIADRSVLLLAKYLKKYDGQMWHKKQKLRIITSSIAQLAAGIISSNVEVSSGLYMTDRAVSVRF